MTTPNTETQPFFQVIVLRSHKLLQYDSRDYRTIKALIEEARQAGKLTYTQYARDQLISLIQHWAAALRISGDRSYRAPMLEQFDSSLVTEEIKPRLLEEARLFLHHTFTDIGVSAEAIDDLLNIVLSKITLDWNQSS